MSANLSDVAGPMSNRRLCHQGFPVYEDGSQELNHQKTCDEATDRGMFIKIPYKKIISAAFQEEAVAELQLYFAEFQNRDGKQIDSQAWCFRLEQKHGASDQNRAL